MSPFSLIDASRLQARGSIVEDHTFMAARTCALFQKREETPREGKRQDKRFSLSGAMFAGILMSFGVRSNMRVPFDEGGERRHGHYPD
ncbi:MAG TPA: hypothetical protein VG320_30360 [Paraburkholderia sp.]|uniref:hypothetical protein n=1 Tax=Paraburkholderia sp. TaxID=1926495 RepID=UPI002DEC8CC6|nr:hypothetical protein [Paraburkholderia sp.]